MGDGLGLGRAVDGENFCLGSNGLEIVQQAWEDWRTSGIDGAQMRKLPLVIPARGNYTFPEGRRSAGTHGLIALNLPYDRTGGDAPRLAQIACRNQAGSAGGQVSQYEYWQRGQIYLTCLATKGLFQRTMLRQQKAMCAQCHFRQTGAPACEGQ